MSCARRYSKGATHIWQLTDGAITTLKRKTCRATSLDDSDNESLNLKLQAKVIPLIARV